MLSNTSSMFKEASMFNQDIGDWNTANVTDMSSMFNDSNAFNQDIGGWNTANVTNMSQMFKGAINFNQDIGNWNTNNVTDTLSMFKEASSFNQNISSWNTENIVRMDSMFEEATSFNQNLNNWCVYNFESQPNNFSNQSGLTVNNEPRWSTCSDCDVTDNETQNINFIFQNPERALYGWYVHEDEDRNRDDRPRRRIYWKSNDIEGPIIGVNIEKSTLDVYVVFGSYYNATEDMSYSQLVSGIESSEDIPNIFCALEEAERVIIENHNQ